MQVHERAQMAGSEMSSHFVIAHAKKLVSQSLFNEAAVMLSQQGSPPEAQHIQLYCQIALGVLAMKASQQDHAAEWSLKEVLFGLHNRLKVSELNFTVYCVSSKYSNKKRVLALVKGGMQIYIVNTFDTTACTQ